MKTLQEQIDEFYEETGYKLEVRDGKPYYGGYIYLYKSKITKLPDNLVVRGYLDICKTKITKLPKNLVVGGYLDLSYTKVSKLPENLVVGGYLNLYGTKITELPDNLVIGGNFDLNSIKITRLPDNLVVGGHLDLRGTKITELPDNLVVGGYLDLRGTKITELPDNFVVGGCLDLEGIKITELPDNLVVGSWLDLEGIDITSLPENLVVGYNLYLRGSKVAKLPDNLVVGNKVYDVSNTQIIPTLTKEAKEKLKKIKHFLQWNVGGKTYIKADGIFSVVDSHRGNVWITHRVGKDETLYIVTDGEGHYAHGDSLKEAKDDLIFKISDRDISSYENLSLDDEVSFEDAIIMYRTITGACATGTRNYIENRLPTPHKEKYTIRDIITLTDGEYGNEKLKEFFM
jgi:hypothetical protein